MNTKKLVLMSAILAMPFASMQAQAVALAQENKIEGVIVSRDGDTLVVRGEGGSATTVTVNKATKLDKLKGLIGVRSDDVTPALLMPGLRVSVEPESPGKSTTVAKSIQFHASDLEIAQDIQGALSVPQQQIQALIEKVKAQEQELAAVKQQNADQDQKIAAGDAALAKRIGDLADYDLQAESVILFDVNSAVLSEKAKADLKALAAKAKTLKGYLIQVAGYADAQGAASHNQVLSDKRAAVVASYLQQECDVALSRVLTPIAMGVAKPVAENETAQGRAENRRVTVKIATNRGIAQQ